MLVRQVVIPASPEELWDALTEPDAVSAWFGSRVEWDLRPGGHARFVDDDGTIRGGVIDAVRPRRHLRFRWWPEDERQDGGSQVSYDLEPEEDGTRLTVTEQPVPTTPSPRTARAQPAATTSASWTGWDSRLFGCWARAALAPTTVGHATVGHATVGRAVR
ncbi:MAG: SRPBCC domain-containing protein [Actinomycetota bacterium]|nr:SRPBCC domain-containing protein [Actinomycetota bacterium]MDQ6946109.1 SRPBCC domain-containing protein [Actinomycetota bacterium]